MAEWEPGRISEISDEKEGRIAMPMVSVIMPVFNAGDGSELEQAIQSILQQTIRNFTRVLIGVNKYEYCLKSSAV